MSIEKSSNSPDPIVIDGISYIPSSVLLTGIPKISFKDNHSFGVVDSLGESPRIYSASSELGFYCNDTRFLQIWELSINGQRPVSLSKELRFQGNTLVFSMTNPDLPSIESGRRIPRETFLIRRVQTLLDDTLFETVEIKNFHNQPYTLQLEQWAGGRFDDVFEVRGFSRPTRGRMLAVQEGTDRYTTVLQYEGLDGRTRRTYIRRYYEAEKIRTSPSLVGHFTRVTVPAKGEVSIRTIVSFDHPSDGMFLKSDYGKIGISEKMKLLANHIVTNPFGGIQFHSDNAILNRAIRNAQTDIFMLLTEESKGLYYPYAGVPWFSAPFGRDGLITAYQLLPWYPKFALGVLKYAFQTLGKTVDAFTDEQPGKVFHEMRRGEMALTREVPFIPYYGSIDSTPLCLILLYEYVRWTMDLEHLREWWPEALRAMAWIEKWGDADGDGFLEYERQSSTGLVNQGWKDSNDSVMHIDGTLAHTPIRLCEVQGYAFRARIAMAGLAKMLGKTDLAERFRMEALRLRIRFNEKFWDQSRKFVYLALDGASKPCAVRSSNMGHCLWSEILDHDQATAVSGHLMSDAMFSGYGVRTLADTEVAYNPMSYHNGSIWPHDNSILLEGLRYYGFTREVETLALAMLGVVELSEDFRLPELFCGFRKRANVPPVPYEVACKPQAWAAGSIFLMLRAMLGVSMDVDQNHLIVNSPVLTPKIDNFEINGLRGRDWEIDLAFQRGGGAASVEVMRKSGKVRVLKVRS